MPQGEALAGSKVREHEGERDEGGFVSESRSSPANFVLFTVREGPFLVFLLGFLPFHSSSLYPYIASLRLLSPPVVIYSGDYSSIESTR